MNIHEYQAKEILLQFGIPIIPWKIVRNGNEAAKAFEEIGASLAVIKAQVHAGGRGKGGGVKLLRSAQDAKEIADRILSKPLITPQTGPAGVPVNKLLIAQAVDMAHEYYIGIILNRNAGCPMLITCAEGGIDIEEIAKNHPEKIIKQLIDPVEGLYPFQARKIALQMGFTGKHIEIATQILLGLSQAYLKYDCSILEINPLVKTPPIDGVEKIYALDAKIAFEDNAHFRHEKVYESFRDDTETPAAEIRAREGNLSYISLDGNIGCMVNGAGLAMATMDIIKYAGGQPANFLDVGGSANQNQIAEGFKIILSDSRVQAILVNIFGGIAHCDIIASGILSAVREIGMKVPLVVRLEGTNMKEGKELLENSKLAIITASNMKEAAEKVVAAAHAYANKN